MAKTRGGHSASPSSPTPRPPRAAMGAAALPPVQAPAIPPSEGEAPSQRRYPTRRPPTHPLPPVDQATSPVPRPPAKRTKVLGPGEPSHAPQPEPSTEEPRIPPDIPLETVIRRPMLAGPPIEGNLDCRDRPFHSETYFDREGDFYSLGIDQERASIWDAPH
ncbi:extensin-like [Vitis vinifera]|uniref:extensin-like n=1 Tax=Vitis vinifera TaxID=29760 RepID=UPI00053F7538|nr:extensin-like [Vitis vinifera]|eukprot:XP_010660162.1 PREDICTED: extensin-like [Vitis vinifera]